MALCGVQFLTLCLVICLYVTNARQTRSIDAIEATNIPYQISIQNTSGHQLCGGAILDATHVLTTAYCIVDTNSIPYPDVREVVVGTTDQFNLTQDNVFQIVKKTIHENFSAEFFLQHDIALLKMDKRIKFTPFQKPVKLPPNDARVREVAISSGWGATQWSEVHQGGDGYPRYFRYFHQKIISEKKCQMMMPNSIISPNHLCTWAGGRSASCKGDNGGPLVIGEYIVGVNSWNVHCNPSHPDVYTRVYKYVDWIKDAMAD